MAQRITAQAALPEDLGSVPMLVIDTSSAESSSQFLATKALLETTPGSDAMEVWVYKALARP